MQNHALQTESDLKKNILPFSKMLILTFDESKPRAVSKVAYKSLQNTKIVHFQRMIHPNIVRENVSRDFAKIICIETRKLIQLDQGYQSHQFMSDLDTYIRRYCSSLKMACKPPLKKIPLDEIHKVYELAAFTGKNGYQIWIKSKDLEKKKK